MAAVAPKVINTLFVVYSAVEPTELGREPTTPKELEDALKNLEWFKNRRGTEPMDPGSVALDFDDVFSFKSLPLWWQATHPSAQNGAMTMESAEQSIRFNQYTGAPIPESTKAK